MKYIDLKIDTIKILETHFLSSELIAREKKIEGYNKYTRSLKIMENETAYN